MAFNNVPWNQLAVYDAVLSVLVERAGLTKKDSEEIIRRIKQMMPDNRQFDEVRATVQRILPEE